MESAIAILSDPLLSCSIFRFSKVTLSTWMDASLMTSESRRGFYNMLVALVEESVMANLTGVNRGYFTRSVLLFGLNIGRYIDVARRAIEGHGNFTFDQMVNNVTVGAFEFLVLSTNVDVWVDTGFKIKFPLNVEGALRDMNVDYVLEDTWSELLSETKLTLNDISNVERRHLAIRAFNENLDGGGYYEDALAAIRGIYGLPPFTPDQLRDFYSRSWGRSDLAGHVLEIVSGRWGATYLMARMVPVFDWASDSPAYRAHN